MSCTTKSFRISTLQAHTNLLKEHHSKPAICTYKAFYLFDTITEYYPQPLNKNTHLSLHNWQKHMNRILLKLKIQLN